jgi:hypothetical protein
MIRIEYHHLRDHAGVSERPLTTKG